MVFSVNDKIKSFKDLISDLIGFDFGRSFSVEIDSKTYLDGKVKSGIDRIYKISLKGEENNVIIKEKAVPHKVIYELFINNELKYEFYPMANLDQFSVFSYENRVKYKIVQSLNMNAKIFHNSEEVALIKSDRSLLLPDGGCQLIIKDVEDKLLMSFIVLVWDRLMEINALPD